MPTLPYAPRRLAHAAFVPVRGLNYHVLQWGGAALATPERPPLVMVHGWMDVAASFQFVVDALRFEMATELLELLEDPGVDPLVTSGADRCRRAGRVRDPRVARPQDQHPATLEVSEDPAREVDAEAVGLGREASMLVAAEVAGSSRVARDVDASIDAFYAKHAGDTMRAIRAAYHIDFAPDFDALTEALWPLVERTVRSDVCVSWATTIVGEFLAREG